MKANDKNVVIKDYDQVKEKLASVEVSGVFKTLRKFQAKVHVTAIQLERAFTTRKISLTEIIVVRTA